MSIIHQDLRARFYVLQCKDPYSVLPVHEAYICSTVGWPCLDGTRGVVYESRRITEVRRIQSECTVQLEGVASTAVCSNFAATVESGLIYELTNVL